MSQSANTATIQVTYDDKTVRHFLIASLVFAIVGMGVGVLCAFQLNFWKMNGHFLEVLTFGAFKTEGVDFLTFGRLRPLHTNAVIFAFVGNMMFAGIYHSTQRLCKTRTASDLLSGIHFWGWQAIIVAAAITLPAGFTRGKEYAELIWPINIAVAVIWVIFAINFFWTLAKRNESSLYVAIWFYIATIITVAMLYIVNHLSIPTSITHSYPIFAGVQDALVQWWYGHNAVAFFLTTPILGIMYYYLPKAANRPVYSYRLSIIHFWALVFIYIWAGPHHLLNTSLPSWLQMLGMLFSLMLWAPSWGGMINGLLTLRGAWDKLRTDPVIKFFVAGLTFYGMATFEGPLLSIRTVNELSHYTDWTIGHVHAGTLGWNGFMAAGMFYWMAPRLWKNNKGANGESVLWRESWANMHFWIGIIGILLYVASMWASGIMQGLMLSATNEAGTQLKHAEFLETLQAIKPLMLFRSIGGTLYLIGFIMCVINIYKTARMGKVVTETVEVAKLNDPTADNSKDWRKVLLADPVIYVVLTTLFIILWIFLPKGMDVGALIIAICLSAQSAWLFHRHTPKWADFYERLEKNWVPFTLLVIGAAAVGGAIQIIPTVIAQKDKYVEERVQQLYTPLELAGRDLYVSEGCNTCHSQMIRMLEGDIMRYGDYSRLGESIYNYPHQWGSKRTGPDLAREKGLRPDKWHYDHLVDPRSTSTGSVMPSYHFMLDKKTDINALPKKIAVQRQLGVPFEPMDQHTIRDKAYSQSLEIARGLVFKDGKLNDEVKYPADIEAYLNDELKKLEDSGKATDQKLLSAIGDEVARRLSEREIIAMIAYLQKLGSYDVVESNEDAPKLVDPDHKHKPTSTSSK
ncbi:bifunctional cbb3-type cytochrome C oxidase subunit I/II [Oceaniferula spumae]|uniref:cytochrome-c oxidase n=1 Tax=Oceaniferula spumae TaxID=2979115 RepID=A0AAT9FSJ9_9BACT